MHIGKLSRAAMLGTLLISLISASPAWASSCSSRPATPTLTVAKMIGPGRVNLLWRNNTSQTGTMWFDIYIRGTGNTNIGHDITGGAGQYVQPGSNGTFAISGLPPTSANYAVAMRARTGSGNSGCVSGTTSNWININRNGY